MNNWKETALDALNRSIQPIPQELNEIDWKGGLSNKTDRLAQHICAFANLSGGGFLVFGINDDAGFEEMDKATIEETTKKLVTGGIEDVIAELKDLTQMHSIVCNPMVRKVLEDAIPKSLSNNAKFFSTSLLNNTDSIYIFDGDISDPSSYILPTKIPMTFGEETEE